MGWPTLDRGIRITVTVNSVFVHDPIQLDFWLCGKRSAVVDNKPPPSPKLLPTSNPCMNKIHFRNGESGLHLSL